MKRLYVATLLCLLVLFGQLVAAPSFSTLVSDARHGSLTESDLSDLLGIIPSHQIDALREIINNPNAYTNINETRAQRAYTTAGNTLEGELLSEFGFVIVNAGNVTNEAVAAAGTEAILVGAPYYDNSRGRVYLYLGGGVGEAGGVNAPINDAFDSIADKIWEGESEGDLFGATLGENLDIDAALPTDIVIGAYKYGMNETGKVYIIGGDAGWTHATSAPAAVRMTATAAGLADLDVTITGSNDYEYFGSSFALVDNFDATGAGNYHLAVGAYRYSSSGDPVPEDYRGRVYLFQDAAVTGDIIAETAAEFIINGKNEGDRFGYSLADAGRFIGDLAAGQDALLVGAYGADNYKGYVNVISLADAAGFTATDLDIVKVQGNYAYVANNAAGAQELAIFDISDQTNPMLTDTYAVGAAEDITLLKQLQMVTHVYLGMMIKLEQLTQLINIMLFQVQHIPWMVLAIWLAHGQVLQLLEIILPYYNQLIYLQLKLQMLIMVLLVKFKLMQFQLTKQVLLQQVVVQTTFILLQMIQMPVTNLHCYMLMQQQLVHLKMVQELITLLTLTMLYHQLIKPITFQLAMVLLTLKWQLLLMLQMLVQLLLLLSVALLFNTQQLLKVVFQELIMLMMLLMLYFQMKLVLGYYWCC
eukprot:TRINITY_DN16378_c0_g1_i1.p1 TRINITY_DN16378_c0_g1~~TRINITY_DN16378_c0_g1_i1.p1  ORF type:complete len:644 (-),score=24.68 TRINITY_DN16378_c0_g1_i1:404-2335(-)